jgi:choline dehydrogenase-like flavoprotein
MFGYKCCDRLPLIQRYTYNSNRCNWPRGKVIGGSSVLNYMLYVRGNKRDYDGWEKAGNYGWSYKDVLPYFIKSEDNRNPYLAKNKDYHGTGGLLTVQEAPYSTPLSTAFIQAGIELGNFFFSLFIPSFRFLYTFQYLEMK